MISESWFLNNEQVKNDDDIFSLSLDFKQFHKICDLEDFYATLDTKPKEALLCMSAAVHKVHNNNEAIIPEVPCILGYSFFAVISITFLL